VPPATAGEHFVARTPTAKVGRLQGHVHLRSNWRTAVNGSLRELEMPQSELARPPYLAQAQFDRIASTLSCMSVARERMGLT
jgi:hypothetical protein